MANKVLLIDDDIVSRKILAKVIEKLGVVVIQSANGKHGWETLCENDDIVFIVTDMIMPDMDGRELIYLLRSQDRFREMPVLVISGVFAEEELGPVMGIAPDHTFFLQKPIDPKSLKQYLVPNIPSLKTAAERAEAH